MADKQTAPLLDSAVLSEEILSLASKRLDALCEKSRREQVSKILNRKRQKWRKRHKLDAQIPHVPRRVDVEVQDKYHLEHTYQELKCTIGNRRLSGLNDAMQLQTQESLHSLEVFSHRLTNEQGALQSYVEGYGIYQPPAGGLLTASGSQDHMGVVKDLEATISQVDALAEIRKMKHALTPRVPQLHNRTLTGNIFDQSLGILHDSGGSMLDSNGIVAGGDGGPDLLDADHAHFIGKEVSVESELQLPHVSVDGGEGGGGRGGGGGEAGGGGDDVVQMVVRGVGSSGCGGGGGGGGEMEGAELLSSPEKFGDDTDIGMEVVCAEEEGDATAAVASVSVTSVSVNGSPSSAAAMMGVGVAPILPATPLQNGVLINGLVDHHHHHHHHLLLQQHHHQHQQQHCSEDEATITERMDSSEGGGEGGVAGPGPAEEAVGEVQLKILALYQDAHYDLRFPVRRYSNQASRAEQPQQLRKVSPATSQQRSGNSSRSHTPLSEAASASSAVAKKKGRPRRTQSVKRGRHKHNASTSSASITQ